MHPMECSTCEYRDTCMDTGCLRLSHDVRDTELITKAAIKFCISQEFGEPNWIIMTGERHAYIFEHAFHRCIKYDKEKTVQGFITNEHRFLDRYEAKKLAMENGQLTEETGLAELFSEDLW